MHLAVGAGRAAIGRIGEQVDASGAAAAAAATIGVAGRAAKLARRARNGAHRAPPAAVVGIAREVGAGAAARRNSHRAGAPPEAIYTQCNRTQRWVSVERSGKMRWYACVQVMLISARKKEAKVLLK